MCPPSHCCAAPHPQAPDLDSAIEIVNGNEHGNGTAIFTHSGYAARKFQHEVRGMPAPRCMRSTGGAAVCQLLAGKHKAPAAAGTATHVCVRGGAVDRGARLDTPPAEWAPRRARVRADSAMPRAPCPHPPPPPDWRGHGGHQRAHPGAAALLQLHRLARQLCGWAACVRGGGHGALAFAAGGRLHAAVGLRTRTGAAPAGCRGVAGACAQEQGGYSRCRERVWWRGAGGCFLQPP